ncbi:MAG: hypothetical protein C4K60_01320 [Ideonella sp. MAG2]|nr:MAG: hypothetical protein C4K60_01320 [Ideonella sp. MAG2]
MTAANAPLKFLHPGWFTLVMGLGGLSLAWHRGCFPCPQGGASGGMGEESAPFATHCGEAARPQPWLGGVAIHQPGEDPP